MTTPRLLSERYELGEVLGYGGMSEVHRGLDTRLGRDVAVKVLRADLARDPQFQMRFSREAQNAAALNHPAIVAVYDTGEVQSEFGPLPYIVMEYVDGQTLREIVKTSGPLSQQQVIEVMADVCAALDFSHRHNIIHRDVKPANIMINHAGAVKVMDFGIARALGEGQNVTQTAAVIGTAQYLSPEQARGEAVDARSDVYAAGCVLFELLTGEPPFTGDSPVAVAYQHVREDPRRPSELEPSIPAALDAVVLKALSKNPLNRYQSAAEMRADLVRVRNGQNPMAPLVMSEDERTAMLTADLGNTPTRRINGRHTPAPPPADDYDDYYDEQPRRSTGKTIGIVAGVLVALGLIGFVSFQIFSGPPPATMVQVPAVTGLPEIDARNQVLSAGLRIGEVTRQESSVEDIDRVVATDPQVGTELPEGRVVNLVVGSGPASVNVPRLEGRTLAEAQDILEEQGLKLGAQTQQETPNPALVDKIIGSTPRAGESVKGGSEVAVVIGVQPTGVPIPNLSGQDVDDAEQELRELGLSPRREDAEDNDTVSGTNPPAGQRVPQGSEVTLLTGNGDEVEMPDVTGRRLEAAEDALRDRGFQKIRVQEETVSNEELEGRVLEQSPKAGKQVATDQSITLVVGDSPGVFGG
jgi:eukaryotic-like serine/threonine-protein kinase